jgi:hypothetical protein
MLRASDLVRLRVNVLRDHAGAIVKAFTVRQTKTRQPVHLGLSDRTRDAAAKLIEAEGNMATITCSPARRIPMAAI